MGYIQDETKVITPFGYYPIAFMKVGDKVLGSDGSFHKILKVYRKHMDGRDSAVVNFRNGVEVVCTGSVDCFHNDERYKNSSVHTVPVKPFRWDESVVKDYADMIGKVKHWGYLPPKIEFCPQSVCNDIMYQIFLSQNIAGLVMSYYVNRIIDLSLVCSLGTASVFSDVKLLPVPSDIGSVLDEYELSSVTGYTAKELCMNDNALVYFSRILFTDGGLTYNDVDRYTSFDGTALCVDYEDYVLRGGIPVRSA